MADHQFCDIAVDIEAIEGVGIRVIIVKGVVGFEFVDS